MIEEEKSGSARSGLRADPAFGEASDLLGVPEAGVGDGDRNHANRR
jgi:hypothetical protein